MDTCTARAGTARLAKITAVIVGKMLILFIMHL
jgi:hypothetical protein